MLRYEAWRPQGDLPIPNLRLNMFVCDIRDVFLLVLAVKVKECEERVEEEEKNRWGRERKLL